LAAAPNVPAPNVGVADAAPNRFVDCVVAVDPNKPYTVEPLFPVFVSQHTFTRVYCVTLDQH